MNIGLLAVDSNYPNLALMKISSYHKARGDKVGWYNPFDHYDKVYMAKVFSFTEDYRQWITNADQIEKGGTGYDIKKVLLPEIDRMIPDYDLYNVDKNLAYGFLTRGCPNRCKWCVVPAKEGNIAPYMDIAEVSAGRKKNVEVVLYLISFLSHQFIAIGKRNYEEYKHDCIWKYGKSPKSLIMYLKSFLYGCVIGLSEKFDESKRILETENNITALVRTTKSEIDDFLKGEKIGKARESKSDIDALCAMRGIETGKNVEICKGIHAEFVSENLRLQ
ncbi:hypothetical protein [Phocaeicola plebeius]|jgi:hypothetical protein|uniref:hypothetical protein n=1 Tax=Phocaeicola plebeius TaxID=310297 RepID=UPI003FD88D9B